MRFEFKIIDEYSEVGTLFVAYLYSKTEGEYATHYNMGTDNESTSHFAAPIPEDRNELIKMIQAGINEMLSLHELKLNGEQPCQPNQK